jgi:hypothetical protein
VHHTGTAEATVHHTGTAEAAVHHTGTGKATAGETGAAKAAMEKAAVSGKAAVAEKMAIAEKTAVTKKAAVVDEKAATTPTWAAPAPAAGDDNPGRNADELGLGRLRRKGGRIESERTDANSDRALKPTVGRKSGHDLPPKRLAAARTLSATLTLGAE